MRLPASGASTRARDWSYGLALLGAHLAFMPLLVLLLPRRVEALAEGDAVAALSRILLTGALVASVANVAAGTLSDGWMRRSGNRRAPLVVGLLITAASYVWLAAADSLFALTAAVIVFQVGLNATLSPLFALLPDYFSHGEKGRIAGLANAALPLSTAAIAPLAWLFPRDHPGGFLLLGGVAVACCAPLVLRWPFPQLREPGVEAAPATSRVARSAGRRDFTLAWVARFLVQLGAAFVIGYLYVFVAAQIGGDSATRAIETGERLGVLALTGTALAIVSALGSGRVSDHLGRRRLPLALAAVTAAIALAVLGTLPGWLAFIAAYALFHAALSGFLAVDTALVAEMLANDPRRAALLGVMNLTNTLPAVVAPVIALLVLERDPTVAVLATAYTVCALGCAVAATAVLGIRSVR